MALKYIWLADQLREIIKEYIQAGQNRLPTEQELCARYRVSRQTVRSALNVLEETKEIRRIKGSGTYITGLSSQENRNVVGVLIPDEQQYEYPAFINDLRTALSAEGFTCKVFPTYSRADQEQQILQFLLKNPLRALLVEPVKSALPTINTVLYEKLLHMGTSIFFLGCAYPRLPQVPVLYEDHIRSASLLVQNLMEKGHTSIAGIFQMDDLRGHLRCQGFLDAMQNKGLFVPDRNIGWFTTQGLDDFRQNHNIDFLKKFLKKITPDCTALVCENDFIAWLFWEEFHAQSPDITPDMELELAAFNTSYLTTSRLLRVTTLTPPSHQLGTMAAHMITDKLKGLPVISQEVPLELICHKPVQPF